MRNIVIAAVAALAIIFSFESASAGSKCDTGNNACAAFWKQMYETEKSRTRTTETVTVKKRVKTATAKVSKDTGGDKSCVILRQRGTGALVTTVGPYKKRNNAHVIASGSAAWKSVGSGIYQATWCIDKSRMKDVKHFTICGDVGHYYFNYSEAKQFKRQSGPLGHDDIARMWTGG